MANKINSINPNIILASGAVVLVFLGGRKIFEALGLIKSADDKKSEAEIKEAILNLSEGDYFDPDYWRKGGAGTLILTAAAADNFAKMIFDAKGFLNDDEAKVYGVFQSLKTRSQISYLAMIFFNKYKKSLLTYLLEMFNESEMVSLAKITNKLPKFNV